MRSGSTTAESLEVVVVEIEEQDKEEIVPDCCADCAFPSSQPNSLPSSPQSQVVSATAVAWSSTPVALHRRLVVSATAIAWSSSPVALYRSLVPSLVNPSPLNSELKQSQAPNPVALYRTQVSESSSSMFIFSELPLLVFFVLRSSAQFLFVG
ncbi:hypothetical protein HN873_013002 [Arachis hypogaea]